MMNRRMMLSAAALAATGGTSLARAFETPRGLAADPNRGAACRKADVPFRTAIEMPTLAYDPAALAPVISASTVGFHYGKHHVGYFNNLKDLLSAEDLASLSLEQVILRHAPERTFGVSRTVFNNAAQIWNHNFYWRSLRAQGGGAPGWAMSQAIDASFGSFTAFRDKFIAASVAQFGSGWAWLVKERCSGRLAIMTTSNAATPLTHRGVVPLLVIDVWEHAYYLDYQNKRADYVKAVFDKLLNWDFAEANLSL